MLHKAQVSLLVAFACYSLAYAEAGSQPRESVSEKLQRIHAQCKQRVEDIADETLRKIYVPPRGDGIGLMLERVEFVDREMPSLQNACVQMQIDMDPVLRSIMDGPKLTV